ncbi:MAG TPA: hypothetical protein ENK18_00720 [Deltaproteobacteria bacterium]|nr:hypothetical protein [Deltaproteobacteria bacterium]
MRGLLVVLVACSGDPLEVTPTTPGSTPDVPLIRSEAPLADMGAWVEATGVDPLASHRPPDSACPLGGVLVEEGGKLEVNTGLCSYAWLEQPLLAGLLPGDEVEVSLWHQDLISEEPAEGHVALLIGDQVVWEITVSIPAEATPYTESVVVAFAAEVGEPLQLHLHNHGANTWNLLRIERQARP